MPDLAYNPNIICATGSEPKVERPPIRKAIGMVLDALHNVECRTMGIERAIYGDDEKDPAQVEGGLNDELGFIYRKLNGLGNRLERIERYVG